MIIKTLNYQEFVLKSISEAYSPKPETANYKLILYVFKVFYISFFTKYT